MKRALVLLLGVFGVAGCGKVASDVRMQSALDFNFALAAQLKTVGITEFSPDGHTKVGAVIREEYTYTLPLSGFPPNNLRETVNAAQNDWAKRYGYMIHRGTERPDLFSVYYGSGNVHVFIHGVAYAEGDQTKIRVFLAFVE